MARSVRLTVDEAWAVLEHARTGILTSLRRDGWPISLPVWFVVLDRRIYISGPENTKKFTRIRNDARVAFLVESGARWAELAGVQLNGRARILDGSDERLALVLGALQAKYGRMRTPRAQMPSATRSHYQTKNGTIEIVPDERILSWDNARLFPPGES